MSIPSQAVNTVTDPFSKFQHVVVLMLENRSFDNLLGNLYGQKDCKTAFPLPAGKKFEGLHFGGPYFNVIPTTVNDGNAGKNLYTTRAGSYFQPYPDPGETYPQVNTQLANEFNPPGNENKSDADKFTVPYNVPAGGMPATPPMSGFVTDFISVLRSLQLKGCMGIFWKFLYKLFRVNAKWFKLNDKIKDYKAIMECYENDQVPVLTTLAHEFAVFDNWHCDVPSQTYPNRAFWHAGYSFGFVNNSPLTKWFKDSGDATLFNRMQDNNVSWNIYTDNIVSITGIVHFNQLLPYHLGADKRFHSFKKFIADAGNGGLPSYSFVEPRFFTPHNDQHPSSYDSLNPVDNVGPVGSVLLGEKLIWEVYNAIKNSTGDAAGKGNTWENTLLIITHDEHGGCYDHVPPGPAPMPGITGITDEQDFTFNRLGIRVPMVMVSAYIEPNTIVNAEQRHTSFIKTMCSKWGLNHLTERDNTAPVFTDVFSKHNEPRNNNTWPQIPEPIIPKAHEEYDFSNQLINDLEKNILRSVSLWKTGSTADAEKIHTAKEAMQYLINLADELPGADPEELMHQGEWFKNLLKKRG